MDNRKMEFNSIMEKYMRNEISYQEAKTSLDRLKNSMKDQAGIPVGPDLGKTGEGNNDRFRSQDIAVIGMAGQFPGAKDVNSLWENLIQGKDLVQELPNNYLDKKRYYSSKKEPGKSNCKWGGILEDRDCFDPLFFNISPREALSMNPHQRLILQESWKALEDAGYNAKELSGSNVGMFIGAEPSEYIYESFTGASDAIVASRLSYYLDLRGPAVIINTACSSSAVAIHMACESLRNNETSLVIAGGVFAELNKGTLITLSQTEMLSPTGKCHTFDEAADGTILSEGVGVIVLKRLSDAVASGDHIYGVIKGSGINQDGASNGITAPNGLAQEQLITEVYRRYNIDPENITYIEAHGTGTKLGDPIEANALVRAFRQFTGKEQYCAVGSAKSNIGHTSAAAGVTGVIKVLLSLKHRKIPRLINFNKLNALIEFDNSPFYINTENIEWKSQNGKPLMAAVSSFGHSGTNAHIVIGEYIPEDNSEKAFFREISNASPVFIPLSARTREALNQYAVNILKFLKQIESDNKENKIDSQNAKVLLQRIAYTLQKGRWAMEERVVFMADTIPGLIQKLEAFIDGKDGMGQCWQGQARQGKDVVRIFDSDKELEHTVKMWIENGKTKKIAELWAHGFNINWDLLYQGKKPQKMSLPTYPFAAEHYWIPETENSYNRKAGEAMASIHPLLGQNISDFSVQRYSSVFSEEEYFLKDYNIEGFTVLPAEVCVEMARAAVVHSAGLAGEECEVHFENFVWTKPFVMKSGLIGLYVDLYLQECGDIVFEIYDKASGGSTHALLYCSGKAAVYSVSQPKGIDLQEIINGCRRLQMMPQQYYEAYEKAGISYGDAYRGLEELYTGPDQVLAKMYLPSSVSDTAEGYIVHPSQMVLAFQAAAAGFAFDAGREMPFESPDKIKNILPSDIEKLEIYRKLPEKFWAYIQSNENQKDTTGLKLDINLCDDAGTVCIRLWGVTLKKFDEPGRESVTELPEDYPSFFSCLIKNADPNEKFAEDKKDKTGSAEELLTGIIGAASMTLKVKPEDIDAETPLEDYGFDAMLFAEFIGLINAEYGCDLKVSQFSEYRNLRHFAQCIIEGQNDIGTALHHQEGKENAGQEKREASGIPDFDRNELQQVQEMDILLGKLLWGQLRAMGLFEGKRVEELSLKDRPGLLGFYRRWMDESLSVLEQRGYIKRDGAEWVVLKTDEEELKTLWTEWDSKKSAWRCNSIISAQVALVEPALRALPGILTGKLPATDILFPNSSVELVQGIYKNNPISDYFNKELSLNVTAFINERIKHDPAAKISIIEIGAGTGGTASMVLKDLSPFSEHIKEYCYTDISKAFLMYAEKEFGPDNPFMTYNIFNVEEPVEGQGIKLGGYDIAIATNVLHATKDIKITLRNVKAALKKNGLLLINEMNTNSLFAHLTFGLLEGWWLYEDPDLRIPGCPGLSSGTWKTVLENEGFKRVFFAAQDAKELGQQIIVAESDGVVYRRYMPQGRPVITQLAPKTGTRQPVENNISDTAAQASNSVQGAMRNPKGNAVSYKTVEGHIRETIIEKLSESLRMDASRIDNDKSFADYGLDSILAVNLVQVINQTLGTNLETTCLFDYSSVNQLTAFVLSQYKDVIASGLKMDSKPVEAMARHIPGNEGNMENRPVAMPVKRKLGFGISDIRKNEMNLAGAVKKDAIAIVGVSGRFPKSDSLEELWQHLADGDDLIEEVTRWDLKAIIGSSSEENTRFCNYGGFMEGIDRFDAAFFGISGIEAKYMDPQQRIFLEESWKALEDAGYAGTEIQERLCGVYVGCVGGDYQQLFAGSPDTPPQSFWGNMGSVIPARISYYLNLHGPAVAVDTACSSSLVAIHLACQGLWSGEIEMALAGGIFIQCTPFLYTAANQAGMLSPTGRCHAFDDSADGFVPGEGVGVVVLKRLKDAVEAGDHIYGVIKGSAINQDGTTNGITAPSAVSQERLERYVYDSFNIKPEEIQLVETHGTGTILGDPIEYGALTKAFRAYTDKKEFCAIGSVKTNFGHTQTAAGVAGLIKVLLALKHRQIPPSLHFKKGNSHIQFKDSPFYVNTELKDWKVEEGTKRCAAVSSFGVSGTNAHMVIEEAPLIKREISKKPGYLIVLSARSFEQLKMRVSQIIEFCEKTPSVDLGNMSYTLLIGRKHFNHRLACIVGHVGELTATLKNWLKKEGMTSGIYTWEINESNRREQPKLNRFGNQCIKECDYTQNPDEYLELLSTIAELYVQGYSLEYHNMFPKNRFTRIPLPSYPFMRKSYWAEQKDVTGLNAVKVDKDTNSNKDENKPFETVISSLVEVLDNELTEYRMKTHEEEEKLKMRQFYEVNGKLADISRGMVLQVFNKMGVFKTAGETYKKAELMEKLKIIPVYHNLFDSLLDFLEKACFISIEGEVISVREALADDVSAQGAKALTRKQKEFISAYPEYQNHLKILSGYMEAYPEILTGKKNYMEIKLPDDVVNSMNSIFRTNRDICIMVTKMVEGYITARIKENPDANIKILAIVQAAGDMGQKIIEVVRPYKKNVGLILICPPGKMLQQVRKQYANEEYSFIEFKVLNIEKSPLEQGFQSDSMEIVIAESTVSAAKQINTALNQLKKLLKTNGLLMLTEVTQVQEFASLILGLTSAWWNFEDSENRLKGSPLVSPVRWRQMLEQGGFRRVRVAGAVPVGEEKLTESIIIGESDGKAEFEKGEMLKSTVHAVIEPVNPSSGHGDAENNNETENELEKNIAEIWKEVLDIDHVGYHDNFRELGGDSILITQIISRMDKLYPFKLDLRSLYDATTVAEMAEIVERELILKLQEIPDDELRHMI